MMRIGTRGSALALAQARQVAAMLLASGVADVEIVEVRTSGDRQMDRPLGEIAGIGVFTREIEEALLRLEVDVAVHSLKDLPTLLPETLVLAAVPGREDPRDVLITRDRSLPYQHNLRRIGISVLVLTGVRNRVEELRMLVPQILSILPLLFPGDAYEIAPLKDHSTGIIFEVALDGPEQT